MNAPKLSNNIIQKGLAFGRHWSGTVRQFRAPRAPRDPAPPASSPRWGFGGAARRRDNRTEDLNVKVCEEATGCVSASACSNRKTIANSCWRSRAKKSRSGSKQSRVIAMLQSPTGATIAAMMKATGWQQHSVRGFLAGVVRKRLKLKLGSKKVDGNRVYQIASADSGKTAARQSKRRPA